MYDFTDYHILLQKIKEDSMRLKCEQYWKEEVDLFTKNIDKTIQFLKAECSDEELCWMSEVFDDLIEVTKNQNLYNAMEDRFQRLTDGLEKERTAVDLQYAKAWLDS